MAKRPNRVLTDAAREVRHTFSRFLSLMILSALAVCFLAGLRATAPDMKLSADRYFDEQRLMDIHVLSTLGLTEEDIEVLEAEEGVSRAEGAYTVDAIVPLGDNDYIVKVLSLSQEEGINIPRLVEGRLPQKAGECLVEPLLLKESGLAVGDTIVLDTGTGSFEDALTREEYTIVGTADSPLYIGIERGSSTLGTGKVSAFVLLPESAFALDYYTDAYLLLEGAADLMTYGTAYEDLTEGWIDSREAFADQRAEHRYQSVLDEANEALEEAQQELDEAKADARQELDDGWRELEDARQELDDGWQEYREGVQELADQIAEAEGEIADGEAELADALTELEDAQGQLADARQELDDGWAEYNDGWADYQQGVLDYEQGVLDYEDGLKQYEDGLKKYEEGWEKYRSGSASLSSAYSQLQSGEAEYSAGKAGFDQMMGLLLAALTDRTDPENPIPLFPSSEALLAALNSEDPTGSEAARGMVDQALPVLKTELESQRDTLAGALEAIAGLKGQQAALKEELEGALESGDTELAAELNEALAALDEQLEGIESALGMDASAAQAALDSLNSSLASFPENAEGLLAAHGQLTAARAQLDSGWSQYHAGAAALSSARRQLSEAKKELNEAKQELDDALAELEDAKTELEDADLQLVDALVELENGEREYADGQLELEDGWAEYREGEQELADARETLDREVREANQELADALRELNDGEREYADGLVDYAEGKQEAEEKIAEAEQELADARAEVADIEPCDWYLLGRNTNAGYLSYSMDADRMGNLAAVFPLIFFLVAALVCLTTMTRMVEEQRTAIGGMKALGFSKGAIAIKYVGYGFLASTLGALVGLAVGLTVLPWIICTAWTILYTIGEIHYSMEPLTSALACLAAVGTVTLAALAACFSALTAVPAELMRPKAPPAGKRVLLERIKPLWRRLSFNQKITIRNLFRYQQRFWMTVVGIGGCAALIVTAFGLRDSIFDVMDKQYDEIYRYTAQVGLVEQVTREETEEVTRLLEGSELVNDWLLCRSESVTAESRDYTVDAVLQVVEDQASLERFVNLRHRTDGEPVTLGDSGVVLTEKLAVLLGLSPGDTFTLDGDRRVAVTVTDTTEHYIQHYIYMTEACYRQLFGEMPVDNLILVDYPNDAPEAQALDTQLVALDGVTSLSLISDTRKTFTSSLESVDYAVVLIIVCAAALAFVVLFNLTNINITERMRELATLKVLGFYDGELAAYVYRENIILTVFGVGLGMVLGKLLHQWLVLTVEIDMLMFGRYLKAASYGWAVLLTVIFSILVNLAAHRRLRKLDMVESLKSVE